MFFIENFKGEIKNSKISLSDTEIRYNDLFLNISGDGRWKDREVYFDFYKIKGNYKNYSFGNISNSTSKYLYLSFLNSVTLVFLSYFDIILQGNHSLL